jgi:hypothetical protein
VQQADAVQPLQRNNRSVARLHAVRNRENVTFWGDGVSEARAEGGWKGGRDTLGFSDFGTRCRNKRHHQRRAAAAAAEHRACDYSRRMRGGGGGEAGAADRRVQQLRGIHEALRILGGGGEGGGGDV